MEYYDRIADCRTEKELLEVWKKKKPVSVTYKEKKEKRTILIDHRNVFISDGITDNAAWERQKGKKILYVLKEAYGETGDWNLSDWLLREKPSSSTWKRVIEWTYGIQNTTASRIAKYSEDIYENNKALFHQIAVANLKKSGGRSSSNYGEIEAYALSDKAEIKKQLEIIAPDIIICGSTFRALNSVYGGRLCREKQKNENWFYYTDIISGKRTLVLDYYHPGNYYPALVNYYAVASIYQQALLYAGQN